MAIFRENHKEKGNFTQISNDIIYDTRITGKAKSFLILMLSKLDTWKFCMEWILRNVKEKKSAVQSGLDELMEFGYLKRERKHINGRFDWEYTVRENPTGKTDDKPDDKSEKPKTEKKESKPTTNNTEKKSDKDSKPENTETPEKIKKEKNYSQKNNEQKNYALKTGSYSNTGSSSNTDSTNTEKSERKATNEKNLFGRYKNISLTLKEYNHLVELYGKDQTDKSIDSMSEYMKIQNKSYPNVYARLDLWIRQDLENVENFKPNPKKTGKCGYKKHYDKDFDVNMYTGWVNDYDCIGY